MRARSYDAECGRFTNEDSAMHGTNWYAYAANEPVSHFDFTGREPLAEINFSINEANGLEVTNIEAMGLKELELEGFQAGTELTIKIEMITAQRLGSFKIMEMMTLFRG